MKKRYYFIFSFLSLVLLISLIIFSVYFFQFLYVKKIIVNLPEYASEEYLRIKIYGSSYNDDGNTISGNFTILNENGLEIAVVERSWSGSYLAVEFARIGMDGKYFVFPSRIYGKNRIIEERRERSHGTLLEKYYDDYGQCMLLGYGSSYQTRKKLYRIAAFATGKYKVPAFGLVTRFSIDLSGCRPDRYYSISFDENGRYVVQEL